MTQHYHEITIQDRSQPMRNSDNSLTCKILPNHPLHDLIRSPVNITRCLVQDENSAGPQHCPCKTKQLLLAM